VNRSPRVVITALGIAQLLGWGTSFYFPAVLGGPIVRDTGWSLAWVVGGTSIGLLVAGLISPRVGRIIDRHTGRPVLAASSVLFAAGLAVIGLAPVLPVYLTGWVLLGAAMGTGLYDAAFAALGQLYGRDARGPITNLTLFGGFASTVCWPLSAYFEQTFGWRGACFAYAALHLCLALPLQLVMPRAELKSRETQASADRAVESVRTSRDEIRMLVLIALVMTLAAGIGSVVVVHLLVFLQARGVEFALAVSLGTLFGPAQVGARVIERLFGRHYHPIWTMVASCVLMAAGLMLLLVGFPLLAIVIVVYGAGYGISWIARGTLPLALFGATGYGRLIGRIAGPFLIIQAVAPLVLAFVAERASDAAALAVTCGFAIAALACLALIRRPPG
jgi:MFS family permease